MESRYFKVADLLLLIANTTIQWPLNSCGESPLRAQDEEFRLCSLCPVASQSGFR
jgi:hypothetical protein